MAVSSHGGNFRVNPGKSFVIQQGYIGFFIAQGPKEVHRQVSDDDDDADDGEFYEFVVIVVTIVVRQSQSR